MEATQIPTDYKLVEPVDEHLFFVSQRCPWAQRQGMPRDPLTFSNQFYNNQWKPSLNYKNPPYNKYQNQWKNYPSPQWQNPQGSWKQPQGAWKPPQGNW